MAPSAVDTLSVGWFDQLPAAYHSLYFARRGGGGIAKANRPEYLHAGYTSPLAAPR